MYQKTEKIYEIQQSGDAEGKMLAIVWDPIEPNRTATLLVEAKSTDASDATVFRHQHGTFIVFFDGTTVTEISGGGMDNGSTKGSPEWNLNLGPGTGAPDFGTEAQFLLQAGYNSGGPYTVNWQVKVTIEEFITDA